MANQPRQNFPPECEAGINMQINADLNSSYIYMSMAFFFDRDDVALNGFHKFFKERSDDFQESAKKLMAYQNKRGGRIMFRDIKTAERNEWGSPVEAMKAALSLELASNKSVTELHKIADDKGDVAFTDFLEGEFLAPKVEMIKKISDYVTNLNRVGTGMGEYMFDKETLDG